jgi:hypothetical protein
LATIVAYVPFDKYGQALSKVFSFFLAD